MIPAIKTFVTSLLWDEAAAQRYCAAVLYLLGSFLQSGGVVPGTSHVITGVAAYSEWGDFFKAAGLFLGAGSKLPSFMGNGAARKSKDA